MHSAVGFVTPKAQLEGHAPQIHAERDRKLAEAREQRKLARQAQREQPQPAAQPRPRPAIDFGAVRAAVTIAAVLELLGCPKDRCSHGKQYRGPCPLHGSTARTSRSFSADLERHIFHCFKCGCSGNALELWAKAKRMAIYDAAIDLCQRLHIPLPTLPATARNGDEEIVAPPSEICTMPSP